MERNKEIEEIAWQIFMRKMRINVVNSISPEQIDEIASDEAYDYYREQATKVWLKKQKALKNKKYKIIEVLPDGKSGMDGGAYVLCFVYSKFKGNFVLSGYMREVKKYLEMNYTNYFCNYSLWYRGLHRDIWEFWKTSTTIHEPQKDSTYLKGKERWCWSVSPEYKWSETAEEKQIRKENTLYFKRLPKRWIPEFDKF